MCKFVQLKKGTRSHLTSAAYVVALCSFPFDLPSLGRSNTRATYKCLNHNVSIHDWSQGNLASFDNLANVFITCQSFRLSEIALVVLFA